MLSLIALPAIAGDADVLKVKATCNKDRVCRFSVTVKHNDQGWDHYANRWEVLTPGGDVLATRVLAHPHDHEQPFTRSLGGVQIPDGLNEVVVRAHDLVHGLGGKQVPVALTF